MARRAPLGLLPRLIHCQHFPPFALSSACSIFSSESFQSNRRHVCVCAPSLSRVRLFSTPWTVACQAPLSKGFSRQEYWGELPFPSPGDLPNPGTEPASLHWQPDSLPPRHQEIPESRLNALQALFPAVPTIILWDRYYFYPHSTDRETKV